MEYTLQGKTEDDTSSIRLGIFIPKQTDNKEKSKKSKTSSSPVLEGKTHKEKSKTSSSPVLEGKTHKEKSKTSSSPVLEGKTHKEKSKTSSSPVLEGKTHTYSSGRSRKRARVESEKVDGQKEPVMVDLEEISLPNNHNIMHEHKQTKRTDAIQRKRRKRKHKRRVEDNTSQSDKMAGNRDNALQYLRTWQTDLSSWSFRKKIQYWLLKNMFDKTKVPKTAFKVLLQYMEGLKGKQRQLAVQRAQEVVGKYQEDTEDAEGSTVNRRMYKRALAVLKVL